MSAKTEADVAKLQQDLLVLSTNMLAAVNALSERIDMLEGGGVNSAAVEGDDIQTKAAPNGKIKKADR